MVGWNLFLANKFRYKMLTIWQYIRIFTSTYMNTIQLSFSISFISLSLQRIHSFSSNKMIASAIHEMNKTNPISHSNSFLFFLRCSHA